MKLVDQIMKATTAKESIEDKIESGVQDIKYTVLQEMHELKKQIETSHAILTSAAEITAGAQQTEPVHVPTPQLDRNSNTDSTNRTGLARFENTTNRGRVKHEIQPNWINPEILQAIKTRDKNKKDKNTEQYKIWRNKVKSFINHSKTDYFSETINNNHNNPRQLWRNLHDITEKRKDHQTAFINDEFGNTILDPEITANTFIKFFTSIYEQYQSNHGNEYDSETIDHNIQSKIPDNIEFSISRVSTGFIKSQFENLKTNKATGIDDISAKFLKMSAPIICQPLSKILNLTIQAGIYP